MAHFSGDEGLLAVLSDARQDPFRTLAHRWLRVPLPQVQPPAILCSFACISVLRLLIPLLCVRVLLGWAMTIMQTKMFCCAMLPLALLFNSYICACQSVCLALRHRAWAAPAI